MNEDQQRAAFEAWHMSENKTAPGTPAEWVFVRHENTGEYMNKWIQSEFEAWQAALASPEVQALRKDAETGQAVQRACKELPEGWEIHFEMERGAGCVSLYHHRFGIEFNDPYEGSASSINAAIDAAMEKQK